MAKYFNYNLKHIRTTSRITQNALAKGTGIERSLLSRIENNLVDTSIENAYKIALFLDIPLEDMISKDLSYVRGNSCFDYIGDIKRRILSIPNKEIDENGKDTLINMVDTLHNLTNKK